MPAEPRRDRCDERDGGGHAIARRPGSAGRRGFSPSLTPPSTSSSRPGCSTTWGTSTRRSERSAASSRPGGTFAATTNGDRTLAELLREAGGFPTVTQFSPENGGDLLRLHFGDVSQRDVTTWATFPAHGAAAAYLASLDPSLARTLPPFAGARRFEGFTTVFTAR